MYYAICVMYVVLGVDNLIFARENDTYNLHTRSTTGVWYTKWTGVRIDYLFISIRFLHKIQIYDMTTNFLLLYEL